MKDLTRKNKVLADMVEIFEKKNLKEMTARHLPSSASYSSSTASTATTTASACCAHAPPHVSKPADVLQPDMIDKLLNFLVDLNLRFCSDVTKTPREPAVSDSVDPNNVPMSSTPP